MENLDANSEEQGLAAQTEPPCPRVEKQPKTPEELTEILKLQCRKNQYVLSEGALARARELFTARCADKPENFANAREVRNMLEKAMLNHAGRVTRLPKEQRTRTVLETLEAEDLEAPV